MVCLHWARCGSYNTLGGGWVGAFASSQQQPLSAATPAAAPRQARHPHNRCVLLVDCIVPQPVPGYALSTIPAAGAATRARSRQAVDVSWPGLQGVSCWGRRHMLSLLLLLLLLLLLPLLLLLLPMVSHFPRNHEPPPVVGPLRIV